MFGVVTTKIREQRKQKSERRDALVVSHPSDFEKYLDTFTVFKCWIRMCVSVALLDIFEIDVIPEDIDVKVPDNLEIADLAVPLMKFAALVKKPPKFIADTLISKDSRKYFIGFEADSISSLNGYLNFRFNRSKYFKQVVTSV